MSAPRRVALLSLGCPKNQVDSELMLGRLAAEGCELVDDADDADTLIVNTCAFIDRAREESVQALLDAGRWKERRDGRQVIAAGCLVQRHGAELRTEMPEIDAFVGLDDIGRVGELVPHGRTMLRLPAAPARREPSSGPALGNFTHLDPRRRLSPPWTAFVKIAEGCDQACGFCAIPTFRGKQRSRTIEDVCAELRGLARDGVVEANLISQDSTGFGRDHGAKDGLADLVRAIDALDEAPAWVRLHYLYPGRITGGLLEALAASRRFVEYVDLPLQHAHPAVLKRMRRPGSAESYLAHLAELRRALPDAGVRSGFIVGFPGETDDEFQTLVDFVQQAGCDAAGIFTYSHEADTPAFALADDVPDEVKEERRQILDDVVENVALGRALQRVGTQLRVLIEGPSEDDPGVAFARWRGQAAEVDGRVVVEGAAHLAAGTLTTVEITSAAPYELTGRLVDGAAA